MPAFGTESGRCAQSAASFIVHSACVGGTQGAVAAFTALCEAVVSWRAIHNDALTMELSRIMQMYKAKLVSAPTMAHAYDSVCHAQYGLSVWA